MTEIAPYEPHAVAVVAHADPTGGRLVAWAQAANAANQLAKALVQTTFVPAHFKGNGGDATAAVLMGDELGLSPLAALRSIYAVHGTPALYARTMVALAQAHGHEIWTEKSTDAEVVVCGRRRGAEHVERSSWTMTRARTAGYTSNKKYSTNPQEMLYSKAAAEVCRKIAADVLAGVPYSVEDLELEQPEPTTTVTRTAGPAKTTARRAAAPAKVEQPEPDLDDAPAEPDLSGLDEFHPDTTSNPAPEPDNVLPLNDEPPITGPQSKMLHALLNENGLGNRDDGLAWIGSRIGREIDSSKELTKAEASKVIEALNALNALSEPPVDEQ
jgi:hypothetical protein